MAGPGAGPLFNESAVFDGRLLVAERNLTRSKAGPLRTDDLDHVRRCRIDLAGFGSWARSLGWTLPVEFPVGEIAKPAASPSAEGATAEKPLSTTERNTLLRIIAVLAVKGYNINPTAGRIDKLGEIRGDAEKLGLSISDETLRKKLREAFDMIENGRLADR
ncbi:MAG: hypothetical protein M9951_03965 [Burkholderiaceae bacterium]|nr:hypothetical protein [Burkholderiaceae bacterium]MEB2319043.1 hypothetical protein [Pseudomonadota bacterium]